MTLICENWKMVFALITDVENRICVCVGTIFQVANVTLIYEICTHLEWNGMAQPSHLTRW